MRRQLPVLLITLVLPLVAFAQDAANLLPNPGFEDATPDGLPVGWAASCTGGSTASRDTTLAHSGKVCGHIVKLADGKSHVAAIIVPTTNVQAGAEYTLSGWGRSDVSVGVAALFLYQYTKDGKFLGCFFSNPLPQKSQSWTPLHTTAKVLPECAWVQIRFEIYGETSKGEAWVDDVYFGKAGPPPPPVRDLTAKLQGNIVSLAWQAPDGVRPSAYRVYASPYARFEPAEEAALAFTRDTHADVPLPPGYAASFAVCALDEALSHSTPVFAGPIVRPGATALPPMLVWADDPGKRWDMALPITVPTGTKEIALEMARGEYQAAQVLVGAPQRPLSGVEVRLTALVGPGKARLTPDNLDLRLQEYVQMPNQARFTPDPLPPAKPVNIEVGMLRGWWLTVRAPENAPPGDYTGKATVTATGLPPVQVPIRVKVWPVTVPRANHYAGSWGIWGTQMAEQEQVTAGSPEYNALLRKYYDFFLEHRMIPRDIPVPLQSPEAAAFVNDDRLTNFAIPCPGGWSKLLTPDGIEQHKKLCQYLRDKGWLAKGYTYWSDEPEEKDYPFIVQLSKQAHEAGTDVPFLMTEQPEKALLGAIDIWCPIAQEFARTLDLCHERQKLGEHVWWYVCCGPTLPWPNYTLLNDPIDARALSWLQVKYGIEGELYWAVTCYPGDVWARGLNDQFPGDGYLCYPGKPRGLDGPVTCIRAEMIREAKQDIELIWLLRQVAAKKGQSAQAEALINRAMAQVCTDFTHFTKKDSDLAAARRMIVGEIVRLGG